MSFAVVVVCVGLDGCHSLSDFKPAFKIIVGSYTAYEYFGGLQKVVEND